MERDTGKAWCGVSCGRDGVHTLAETTCVECLRRRDVLMYAVARPGRERIAELTDPTPSPPPLAGLLKWADPAPPDSSCSYDYVTAETPFGRFLITWKGHKAHPSYDVEETPWGEGLWGFGDLDDAKQAAKAEYLSRIDAALAAQTGEGL